MNQTAAQVERDQTDFLVNELHRERLERLEAERLLTVERVRADEGETVANRLALALVIVLVLNVVYLLRG